MDLWDVLKLMVRRWYIALPLVIVTIVGAGFALAVVKPDYVGTTSMILLPPTARPDNATVVVNPWDPRSLSLATLTYINSKQLHDEFKARGLSEVWAADLDQRSSSLILIEVTSPTPEQTLATAAALQARMVAEVNRLQEPYNLSSAERVTAIPFDSGENLAPSTTKGKRTLIVVVAVGMIITVGLTVAIDALARRRARRREVDEFPSPADPSRRGLNIARVPEPPQLRSSELPAFAWGTGSHPVQTAPTPPATTSVVPDIQPPRDPVDGSDERSGLDGLPPQDESTATIVLPLWMPVSSRGGKERRGPGGAGGAGSDNGNR